MPSKCLLILLDGLGDRACDALAGLTPLQAAATPTLDRIAIQGANGLYHAGRLGQALPSENAHFAIFGYDLADFPGRGPLEALGAGIDLAPNEVAILAHLVSVAHDQGRLRLVQDVPKASPEEISELAEMIHSFSRRSVQVTFHHTHSVFGILTLKGEVSPWITDTNPMRDGRLLSEPLPLVSHATDPFTQATARVLKDYLLFCHATLGPHSLNTGRARTNLPPINGLVTQRAGRLRSPQSFTERNGLRGLCMASGLVYCGLSRYLGLEYLRVTDRGDAGADMAERLILARKALATHDFVHLHTKVPDEAAHRKDPLLKRRVIEALEKDDAQAARSALPNEHNLNRMQLEFRRSHVQRMTEGLCTPESGLIFIDLVDNVEKVGDHLTNIAQAVIGGLQWDGIELKVSLPR